GEDRARADALGVGVAVLAVGGDDVIFLLDRRDRPDADGLLADAEMEKTADLALRVRLGRRFLHPADGENLPVELGEQGLVVLDFPLAALDSSRPRAAVRDVHDVSFV